MKNTILALCLAYGIDGDVFIDSSNEDDALALFESGSLARKHKVTTSAPSAKLFEKAILKKAAEGFERIIVQTVNRTQGETYANANEGATAAEAALVGQDVIVRVMDSRTVFAGQALMAAETIRRMLKSDDETLVRRSMDKLSEKIHTYILPKEPLVALERARERNEKSVSWTQAMLATKLGIHPVICNVNDASSSVANVWGFKKAARQLFEYVGSCIEQGTRCPIVVVNYCGPLDELKKLPGFSELAQKAKQHKMTLIFSVASVASGIYASVGSLSVAVATDAQSWV